MGVNTAFSLGIILLAGLLSAKLIQKLKIPIITAYILLGVLIGPHALNLVSKSIFDSSGLISNVVLSFVAFSLGQNFSLERFRRIGKSVLFISIGEVLGALLIVTLAIWLLLRQPFYIALIFGAIAPATAPAAVVAVTREYKAKGSFTDTLLGVVAIDDAWGIILFAFCLAIAKSLAGAHKFIVDSAISGVYNASLEILGAIGVSGILGFLLSKLSKHVTTPSECLIYTLGAILINTGLAIYFGLSVLLASMFLGAVLANMSKSSFKFFDALHSTDPPFYVLFFVLAGANFEIDLLHHVSLLALVYLLTRLPGEMLGATLGAHFAGVSSRIKKYIGLGLAPQAGVALGFALIVKDTFSNSVGGMIFSSILTTTIVYELIGPIFTKYALFKSGDAL